MSDHPRVQITWRNGPHFSTAHVDWGTCRTIYEALNTEFRFTLDPCPVGGVDGLSMSWKQHRVFCNPC